MEMPITLTVFCFLISWYIIENDFTREALEWAYSKTERVRPVQFILEHLACFKCSAFWITLFVTWNPICALIASFAATQYDAYIRRD